MMTAPIREQMYKAATGFAIMACLAVACIHVPVQLAKVISPGLFPLHLKVSRPGQDSCLWLCISGSVQVCSAAQAM